MGILNRLFGATPDRPSPPNTATDGANDDAAIQRYRYLLRTAPPEAIEQAHAEAFTQLTPEQRARVLRDLHQGLPPAEQSSAPNQSDPQTLARMATRQEIRQPGSLERIFGGAGGGGMGMGGFGSSILGSIAGTFIGSAIAHQFLGGFDHGGEGTAHGAMDPSAAEPAHESAVDESPEDYGDTGGDLGGDFGDDI